MNPRHVFGRAERRQALAFLAVRVLAILLAAAALLYAVAVTPGVPYHVRELFGSGPTPLQALLFAVMVLLALGPPALFGLQLIRQPKPWAWLFPIALLAHAVVIFLIFRFATPIESVHDLVGMPLWPVPAELERLVRFIAVFLVFSVSIAGGTAMLYAINRSYEPLRFLWWLLYAVVFLGFGYWVVVVLAATDNVTLLLRGDANPLSWIAISLWMLLMAFGASVLAERLAGVFAGTLAAVFAQVLLLVVTYSVAFLATEPKVLGPESRLSALEFLLSASRNEYGLSDLQLFLRYTAAYVAVMLLLTFAQYPVWVAYSTRRFARKPSPAPLGSVPADEVAGAGSNDPG
ncbi:MAG: hypothetical protein GVY09_10130 [Gammaproteobacteria bacterium]|nr:hypothetical protein [Gammaproteobacteria bacterium]